MVPLDDLRLQTSERNSFWVMLMLQTQGELSESMSYFGLGSSNSSTQARTHSPGRSSSSGGGFCDQRQRARHLINDCLWFTAVAQQRKVLQRRASRSCTSISSPGQTSPRSRMRYRLAELRNSKQVFGPPRWKCAGEERSNRGRANGVKGHQRGGVQYLQPTTGAESKARLSRYKLQRRAAELVSFPWLTTIISCEVFAGSEITASSLSRAPLCPSCRQRRHQPDLR